MSSLCSSSCLSSVKKQKHDFQDFLIVMFSSVRLTYCYLLSKKAFIQFIKYCLMLRLFCQSNYVLLACIFLHLKRIKSVVDFLNCEDCSRVCVLSLTGVRLDLFASNFDLLARPGFSANYITCHQTRDKLYCWWTFSYLLCNCQFFCGEMCFSCSLSLDF